MKFRYPRLQFLIRFAIFTAMMVTFLLFLTIPDTDPIWMLAIAVLGCAAAAVALTPALTSHEISSEGITLRQGVLFKAFIPFRDIISVESTQMRLWAFGMFPAAATRGRIVLASGMRNIVSIKLKQKRRFGQLLWRSSDELIIDLNEPDEFVRTVVEKLQG